MPDLDDEAITVTLPPEDMGGAVITEVEKKVEQKPAADDPISDLKGQFETLKGTLNQTTQRLVGAERELETTRQQLESSKKEVTTSQLDTVLSGIQAAEADANAAEREYIAAAEVGDFAAQARAQRKISGAEARIQRLKEAEADLKDTTAKPVTKQEPRQQQPSAQDPVEAVASNMAPRAAAWIRSHPDYVTDKSKNAKMLATHYAALAEGLPEGGDEYFARLDEMATPKAKVEPKPEPKVNIRPSAPVAPSGGTGGTNGSIDVKLTERERIAATDGTHTWNYNDPKGKFKKDDPIGVQEFARRKVIMQKQGLYDRSFNEQ